VDHLFRFTTVHRLEAGTDAENVAEQKALERIGFTREGVLREVAFRDGTWRGTPALRVAAPGLAGTLKRAAFSRCPR
jgi:RimJ/RimL family protein N-acetyltransferase